MASPLIIPLPLIIYLTQAMIMFYFGIVGGVGISGTNTTCMFVLYTLALVGHSLNFTAFTKNCSAQIVIECSQ